MKQILVTGGAGFIGSHTCLEMLNAGFEIIVLDNLSNSKETSLERVQAITGKTLIFHQADLLNRDALDQIFDQHEIDAVIHFAGLKAVGESNEIPLSYFQNNVAGTLNLCEAMKRKGCHNIVFSSSATVYGDPKSSPITEDFDLFVTNPYGRSKLMVEDIFRDLYASDASWNISLLRYFNPVGAHSSGKIGEDPNGIPNNLFPYITQVAIGKLKELKIFGNDYETHDGTGIRDYIHVVDLARGHISALEMIFQSPGLVVHNLGTGKGYSVLDIVRAFEKVCGKPLPHRFVERRSGDAAICYADPEKANRELKWKATLSIDDMCIDAYRWQQQNPDGYA